MAANHYDILRIHPGASQTEIKQAYRRLAKLFHPDSSPTGGNHDQISQINAAYEILGDPQHRRSYDWQLHSQASNRLSSGSRAWAAAQKHYRERQYSGHTDEHLRRWLKQVYSPVNQLLSMILDSLQEQLDELAADPFDDALMEGFQLYLADCRQRLNQAQQSFQAFPNPTNVAGVAAHLYYCLNQVGDGIEELEYFTLNYDDHYLHTGQELFRIAASLRLEAENVIEDIV